MVLQHKGCIVNFERIGPTWRVRRVTSSLKIHTIDVCISVGFHIIRVGRVTRQGRRARESEISTWHTPGCRHEIGVNEHDTGSDSRALPLCVTSLICKQAQSCPFVTSTKVSQFSDLPLGHSFSFLADDRHVFSFLPPHTLSPLSQFGDAMTLNGSESTSSRCRNQINQILLFQSPEKYFWHCLWILKLLFQLQQT